MKGIIIVSLVLALLLAGGTLLAQTPNDARLTVPAPQGAKLHIDVVRIKNLQCGKPLEFNVIVKNIGTTAFNGPATVVISIHGNHISHGPFTMNLAPGATLTDKQSTLNQSFLADCCKDVNFTVTLAATDAGGDVPAWDKVPYTISTKPGSVVVVNK